MMHTGPPTAWEARLPVQPSGTIVDLFFIPLGTAGSFDADAFLIS